MKKFDIKSTIAKIKAKPSKFIYSVLLVLFASVFLFSTGFLIVYFINSNKQNKQNDELANLVEQMQQEINNGNNATIVNPDGSLNIDPENPLLNDNNTYMEITDPKTGDLIDVLREYSSVYLMNPDMVGWIKIPGTQLNYPVLRNSEDPNYYLKRDFYGQYARHGSVFAHALADLAAPSDNITLFGHNMGDGSMFAALHEYEKPEFYQEHPYIFFDTLTSHQIYRVVAAFYTTDQDTTFIYHDFIDGDEAHFMYYVDRCKELAMYDTGVTPVYGNKLLTLSTCDNDVIDPHGRFVVVAMRVSL